MMITGEAGQGDEWFKVQKGSPSFMDGNMTGEGKIN